MTTDTLQFLYVASTAVVVSLAVARPHWLLRPSFAFACTMTIIINFSAAFVFQPDWPDSQVSDSTRLHAIMFPIAICIWIGCTPFLSQTARRLLSECRRSTGETNSDCRIDKFVIGAFSVAIAIIALWYFWSVPLRSTGLWTIFFEPEQAGQAREESLKLLDSKSLKYAYSICTNVIVPTTIFVCLVRISKRKAITSSAILLGVLAVLIFAGISGARMPVAKILLTVAVAIALTSRSRRWLVVLPLSVAGAFCLIAALSFLREGQGATGPTDMFLGIANRAFVMPFETGLLSVDFAGNEGFLDGANVRPFAIITGQEYLALPSEIYQTYYFAEAGGEIESGLAPTCFLFDFQAGFGISLGWWISLAGIASLDFGLLAFRRLKGAALPALLATFLFVAAIDLTGSAYTTQLLTGGIAIIIVLALFLAVISNEDTVSRPTDRPKKHHQPVGWPVAQGQIEDPRRRFE